MEKAAELREKLKEDTGKWEEGIFRSVCVFVQTLAKNVLEELENELMKERDDGMKEINFKEHWLSTIFGDTRINRIINIRPIEDSRAQS